MEDYVPYIVAGVLILIGVGYFLYERSKPDDPNRPPAPPNPPGN